MILSFPLEMSRNCELAPPHPSGKLVKPPPTVPPPLAGGGGGWTRFTHRGGGAVWALLIWLCGFSEKFREVMTPKAQTCNSRRTSSNPRTASGQNWVKGQNPSQTRPNICSFSGRRYGSSHASSAAATLAPAARSLSRFDAVLEHKDLKGEQTPEAIPL